MEDAAELVTLAVDAAGGREKDPFRWILEIWQTTCPLPAPDPGQARQGSDSHGHGQPYLAWPLGGGFIWSVKCAKRGIKSRAYMAHTERDISRVGERNGGRGGGERDTHTEREIIERHQHTRAGMKIAQLMFGAGVMDWMQRVALTRPIILRTVLFCPVLPLPRLFFFFFLAPASFSLSGRLAG